MHQEDALLYILQLVREEQPSAYSGYGYDICIPSVISFYVFSTYKEENRQRVRELSPVFFDAAWELCRRGVIRPGVRRMGAQSTDEGNAGSGFSITPFGRQWIAEAQQDTFVPTEPERFA